MRQRDLAVLFVSGMAVLVSLQQSGMYKLEKTWAERIDQQLYHNGGFPEKADRIPSPVVTDLDGDGIADIVVVTREPKVKVLDTLHPVVHMEGDNEVNLYPVKHEVSLLSSVSVTTGRHVVAIATGYLSSFDAPPATQVIVVLLEEWTVMCFDHKLTLLWETLLQDDIGELTNHKIFSEAAIAITPQGLFQQDTKGAVVVGGRLQASPRALAMDDPMSAVHEEFQSHFSYVALDGATGKLRWKHTAEDFHELDEEERHALKTPQINYKLSVQDNRHTGERNWRQFRSALVESLPHRWSERRDTQILPVHILPDKPHPPATARPDHAADEMQDASSTLLFPTHQVASALRGLSASLSSAAHQTDHANAVLVKIYGGVEVLHLFTGRPVTQMPLEPGSTHVDVNEDGTVDHISAQYRSADHDDPAHPNAAPRLHLVASTGMPAHTELFATPLSTPAVAGSWFGSSLVAVQQERVEPHDVFVLTPLPAILFRKNPTTGQRSPHVVHVRSDGTVACVDSRGRVVWLTRTPCGWVDNEMGAGPIVPRPSLLVAQLVASSDEEFVVVTGATVAAVLSQDGDLLADVVLPGTVVGTTVLADITRDGLQDIIVETVFGYFGYRVVLSGGSIVSQFVGALLVLACCCVVAAMFSQGVMASLSKATPSRSARRSKYSVD